MNYFFILCQFAHEPQLHKEKEIFFQALQ